METAREADVAKSSQPLTSLASSIPSSSTTTATAAPTPNTDAKPSSRTPATSSNASSSSSGKMPAALWSNDQNDFLAALDSYNPTVPEAVSEYFLKTSGSSIKDYRVAKLMSLATDKFLADTINLASQNARLRRQNIKIPESRKKEEKRKQEITEAFEIEDLYGAFVQQNIHPVPKKVKQ